MKKYKVVKDFDILTKGDIFELTEENKYVCNVKESSDGFSYNSTVTISPLYMAKAMKEGYVIELDPQDTTNYKRLYEIYKNSWDKTFNALQKWGADYQADIENAVKEYNAGNMPECQKLETTTVLANLIKQIEDVKAKMKL